MFLCALYLALCRHSGGIVASKILTILLLKNCKDDSSFGMKKKVDEQQNFMHRKPEETPLLPTGFSMQPFNAMFHF